MSAAPDVLARLRHDYENWSLGSKGPAILLEAADEIERLRVSLDEISHLCENPVNYAAAFRKVRAAARRSRELK